MEEVIDFDLWLTNFKPEPIKHVAIFDPQDGSVIKVGPSYAFENETNKIIIDSEIAISIILGEISIGKCVVDIHAGKLEIAEIKTVSKIDDLLHRIISSEYSTTLVNDVYLTVHQGLLTIELADYLGGTYSTDGSIKKRKIIWNGDTEMSFMITEYNDPNLLLGTICVKINDLIGNKVIIDASNFTQEKFSLYTRRLFKNYVIEYK